MIGIIILGIIQGIAEFLPISSSAHLIIFRDIFNIGKEFTGNIALTFDIALHFGTLMAILIYFFKDFLRIITKGLTKGTKDKDGKIFWYLLIATIPAGLSGVLFEDKIDSLIRNNYILIALALIIMGIIIYIQDKRSKQSKTIDKLLFKDVIIIGFSQVLALIPGFSRSGTTIAAGRTLKLNREDAAKFSFYLSAPVIFGATVFSLFKADTISIILNSPSIFIIGILISFIAGILCINFLLKYIKNNDFKVFMWYRVLLGLLVIILTFFR